MIQSQGGGKWEGSGRCKGGEHVSLTERMEGKERSRGIALFLSCRGLSSGSTARLRRFSNCSSFLACQGGRGVRGGGRERRERKVTGDGGEGGGVGEQQKGSQNHKLLLTAANYVQITPTLYSYSGQEWLAITPLTVPLQTPPLQENHCPTGFVSSSSQPFLLV